MEIDFRTSEISFLCLDQDDTVCTAYTVYGTGGGVFKYRERLDLGCRKVIEAALDTVDKYQRVASCTLERGYTADPEGGAVISRFTGSLYGYYTGKLSGKVVGHCTGRSLLEGSRVHGRDGPYDGGPFLLSVCDHYRLVEAVGGLPHVDVDVDLVPDSDGYRFESEVAEFKD